MNYFKTEHYGYLIKRETPLWSSHKICCIKTCHRSKKRREIKGSYGGFSYKLVAWYIYKVLINFVMSSFGGGDDNESNVVVMMTMV